MRVTPQDGEPVEFGAGDVVVFPAGMECVWEVIEPIRKHYAFGDTPFSGEQASSAASRPSRRPVHPVPVVPRLDPEVALRQPLPPPHDERAARPQRAHQARQDLPLQALVVVGKGQVPARDGEG